MSRAHVIVAATLLAAAGCRQSPPPPPKAATIESDALVLAREAMARHDYREAAGWLHKSLDRRPDDFEAHYRLGVTASHLDRLEEAEAEFQWVVTQGAAESPEVKIASAWLASRRAPSVSAAGASALLEEPRPQKPELASLEGEAQGPDGPLAWLQLILTGLSGSGVNDEHVVRTDQQGRFHFPNVAPGEYKLTTALRAPVRWRLRVRLAQGKRQVLDLSPSNQLAVRDDFPDPAPVSASQTPGEIESRPR